MRRAVFIDRDGTVMEDKGYLADPEGVVLIPGATEALAALRKAGLLLVLVTNQSGVGRGMFAMADVEAVHRRLLELLAEGGVAFDDIEVCPHTPDDDCACRKPRPGMLLAAARKLGIDLTRSFMVGDKDTDMEAGRRVGCRTICVGTEPSPHADVQVAGLKEAAAWILSEVPGPGITEDSG